MNKIDIRDAIDDGAGCLRSAADTIQDLVKPNSGRYADADHFKIVAKRLEEAAEKLRHSH